MNTALLQTYFSKKSFLQGIAVAIVVFLSVWAYGLATSEKQSLEIENALNYKTATIQKIDIGDPQDDTSAESTEYAPSLAQIESYTPAADRKALYPAPVNGLFDRAPVGILPKISENGVSPFEAYKKPFVPSGKPMIALVVRDFGLSEKTAQDIIQSLPDTVTLILSPYAVDPGKLQDSARQNGFETWMNMPIQKKDFLSNDPGAKTLLSHYSLKQNQDIAEWVLSRAAGYAGIAMDNDEASTQSRPLVDLIIQNSFGRGLGYFEINPHAPLAIETIAAENESPYLKNSVILGNSSFKSLEEKALENKYAIAVIDPYPNTIKALNIWVSTLEAKGIELAPLSAVYTLQMSSPAPVSTTATTATTTPTPETPDTEHDGH